MYNTYVLLFIWFLNIGYYFVWVLVLVFKIGSQSGICSVDHASLELSDMDPPVSASRVLGLKAPSSDEYYFIYRGKASYLQVHIETLTCNMYSYCFLFVLRSTRN